MQVLTSVKNEAVDTNLFISSDTDTANQALFVTQRTQGR